MQSVAAELYQSFKEVGGWVFTVIGLALAVWGFIAPAPLNVDVRWLIASILLILIVVAVLSNFAFNVRKKCKLDLMDINNKISDLSTNSIPRVINVTVYNDETLLLLSKSDLFGSEAIVSIYLKKDDFEVIIGIGKVNTIQSTGLIQVSVLRRNKSDVWNRIDSLDKDVFSLVVVRPSITHQYYELKGFDGDE